MIRSVFALLILFSYATAMALEFTPSQQILMKGGSCAELERHAFAIAEWSRFYTQKPSAVLPECFCSSKSCQMDVASISPYFVRELTNFSVSFSTPSTPYNGPNCFNAALKSSGALPNITFTHPYEMTTVLESSLCVERTRDEALQPGDILVVRDQKNTWREIHAAVYIHPELSFSKYGQNKLMPYSYGAHVEKAYGVKNAACLRLEGAPRPGDECYGQPYVNYFACGSLSALISRLVHQPAGLQERARKIYADTMKWDTKVSNIAFKNAKVTSESLSELQLALEKLYHETLLAQQDPSLNSENKELVQLMRARIFSLYEQTRMVASESGLKALVKVSLARP